MSDNVSNLKVAIILTACAIAFLIALPAFAQNNQQPKVAADDRAGSDSASNSTVSEPRLIRNSDNSTPKNSKSVINGRSGSIENKSQRRSR